METKEIKMMKTKEIEVRSPFKDLFLIDPEILNAVEEHMRVHGFDKSQPIVLWNGVLVEGHTRHEAALKNGIEVVPACEKDFANEDEAIEYAVHNQAHRRNLTDGTLLRLVEKLDQRYKAGRPKKIASGEANFKPHLFDTPSPEDSIEAATSAEKKISYRILQLREQRMEREQKGLRSSERIAHMIKISHSKIEKARTILDRAKLDLANGKIKQAVLNNEMTINMAYKEIMKKSKFFTLKFEDQSVIYITTKKGEIKAEFLNGIDWMVLGTGDAPDMSNFSKDSRLCFPRWKNSWHEIREKFRKAEAKGKKENTAVKKTPIHDIWELR
jgi:hypothetical protein